MPKNRSPQLLRLMASVYTENKAARDTCFGVAAVSVDGNLMPKKAAVDAVVKGMKQSRRRVRILVLASFSPDEGLHPSSPAPQRTPGILGAGLDCRSHRISHTSIHRPSPFETICVEKSVMHAQTCGPNGFSDECSMMLHDSGRHKKDDCKLDVYLV